MTKETMDAALTASGLDPSKFHPWFSDWTGIDYRVFEFTVDDGMWVEKDYNDGLWDGGFEAPVVADGSTLVVHDGESNCDIGFNFDRSGDNLNIDVGDDKCGLDDEMVETAIYEATPFHLIQVPDWEPAELVQGSPPPPHGISSSSKRQVLNAAGTVDGAPLGYLEYLPPSYSASGEKSPLLVFLHGSGESGKGDNLGLAKLSAGGLPLLISSNHWPDDRPFVVLSPQHDDSMPPSFCMESKEIDGFLHFALEHYNVDPSRVYVTGLSCGAIGLWNYLNEHGDELIAAAVPIAGNGLLAVEQRGCDLGKTPIWAFHGAIDASVPVESEVYPMTALQQCTDPAPIDARLNVFPTSGHDVWTRTYSGQDGFDIYSWMLSHQK